MLASDKHLFAVFVAELSASIGSKTHGSVVIKHEDLWHRLVHVLRLQAGERVVLFDQKLVLVAELEQQMFMRKNVLVFNILERQRQQPLLPIINLYQCLPKRAAFEEITYTAAQMGVAKIYPVISSKSQQRMQPHDRQRLEAIMIAACEQSKNFMIPVLHEPCSLQAMLTACKQQSDAQWIFADPAGKSLLTLLNQLAVVDKRTAVINVIIGPEGGFMQEECISFEQHGIIAYALTPTILRSVDAAVVLLGALRSA